MRKPSTTLIMRCLDIQVNVGYRWRGRTLKTRIKVAREDIQGLEITAVLL